jgi:hypothetical protein
MYNMVAPATFTKETHVYFEVDSSPSHHLHLFLAHHLYRALTWIWPTAGTQKMLSPSVLAPDVDVREGGFLCGYPM